MDVNVAEVSDAESPLSASQTSVFDNYSATINFTDKRNTSERVITQYLQENVASSQN